MLVRAFFGRFGQPDLTGLEDPELVKLTLDELRDLLGIQGEPALTRVHRWPRAMPQYLVGHLERLARIEQALGEHPRLVLAGAAYRGIGLPDCIRQGEEAASAALRELFPDAFHEEPLSTTVPHPTQQRGKLLAPRQERAGDHA